ncbi:MAG: Ig-like domain-containing protein [Marinifilaceae bacterium]
MKKLLYLLAFIFVFASCSKDEVDAVKALSVSLGSQSIELYPEETASLVANILPAEVTKKTVMWISTDPSVASVSDNGLLTAIKIGTTDIIVETDNGKKSLCKIYVKQRVIEAASITLSETEKNLYVGKSFNLIAKILPENTTVKSIVWSSSDDKIVSVSDGNLITAHKEGITYITAETSNGKKAVCKIVSAIEMIEATSISFKNPKIQLFEGKSVTLEVKFLPEVANVRALKWLSSDENIASISAEGLITAHKCGTVSITAKTANGKEASCKLDVPIVAATGIQFALAEETVYLTVPAKLKVNFLPEYTTDKTLKWTSSDETIATISTEGIITGVKVGEITITAETLNGKKATCKISVKIDQAIVNKQKEDELAKLLIDAPFSWLSTSFVNISSPAKRVLKMDFKKNGIVMINTESGSPKAGKYTIKANGDDISLFIETYVGFIEPRIALNASFPKGNLFNMEFKVKEYGADKFVLEFIIDTNRELTLTKQTASIDFSKRKAMRTKLGIERNAMFNVFKASKYGGCHKYVTLCITSGLPGASIDTPIKVGFNHSSMTCTADISYNNPAFSKSLSMLVFTETGFVTAHEIELNGKYISNFKFNVATNRYELDEGDIEGHFECFPIPQYSVKGIVDNFLSGYSLWMKSFFPTTLDKMLVAIKEDFNKNTLGLKFDVPYLVTKYKRRQPLFKDDGTPVTLSTGEQDYELKEELGNGILFSFIYAYQFYYYFVPLEAVKIGEDRIKFVRKGVPKIHMKDAAHNAPMLAKCNASVPLKAFIDKICEEEGMLVIKSKLEGSFDFDFRFLKNYNEWFMARNK